MTTLSDFTAKRLQGAEGKLSDYAGKPVLVVNVASQCGNTPQYDGLEKLYETYGPKGLVILGFPCNQFGEQEPGTASEIESFCKINYGVTFPLFSKVEVNGDGTTPLYRWLKLETPGSDNRDIEWNFAKFLIGPDGKPVKRYGDKFMPEDIAPDIEKLL
jgi:glutathione peroxidase